MSRLLSAIFLSLFVASSKAHVSVVGHTLSGTNGLKDENACKTCQVVSRVLSDYLCDFEFIAWAVEKVDETLCASVPQKEQCEQVRFM
jgi:hypothetical protein